MPSKKERQQTPTILVSRVLGGGLVLELKYFRPFFRMTESQTHHLSWGGLGWQVQHPFKEQGCIPTRPGCSEAHFLVLVFHHPCCTKFLLYIQSELTPFSLKLEVNSSPLIPSQQAILKCLSPPFSHPLGTERPQ